MIQERPLMSVIVPVYNVEGYLEACLASLAAQTYFQIEVILVDDASTDGSGRICDAWAARDGRFQVLHLPENRGPSVARNRGVSLASGDYIAFVDSDDYVEHHFLEALYDALKENRGEISICGSEGLHLKAGPARLLSPEEAARCMARRALFLWTAWGKLFPAELAKQIPFDSQALCCEDLLFFYQVLKRVRRIAYVPDPLYHYVYREGSIINHGVTEERCTVLPVLDWICGDVAGFPEIETCFHQIAMDTAVRLAMQSMEIGTESSVRDYLKRFRNTVRFHFSWRALTLCPDKKSVAAQLALCAGVPAFGALAVVYRLIKSMRKNGRG
ncbi:MAG: glycosyltransferase family 2 protein [Lawsonibacter sp.]|nr:glycosyltransferase family 2 protein [Oscillospiraceae bacterium]MCI9027264.1 glycosyltransferase family 2 protein [Lawsonibacter sp.]